MYTKVSSRSKPHFQFVNFNISVFFFGQMYFRGPSTVPYLYFRPLAVFSFDSTFYVFLILAIHNSYAMLWKVFISFS